MFSSRFHWKVISYVTVFSIVISLFIMINALFHPLGSVGTDEPVTEEKYQIIITGNKKTQIFPPATDKNNNLESLTESYQLANVETVSPSDEDNKQYIHSFNLWLEPDEFINTLTRFISDNDALVRLQAIIELAMIDNEETIEVLVNALDDEDNNVRAEIINALGNSQTDTEHLLGQIIFSDEEAFLRCQAVRLLAARGTPAAQSLVIAAKNNSDEQVREEAEYWIDSLAWDMDMKVERNPRTFFSNDISYEKKIFIIQQTIVQYGQEQAVGVFREVLMQEDDAGVKLQAIIELATINDYQAEIALATALGDKDSKVRYQAIEALGAYGSKATNILGQAMFSDSEPENRRRSYELLIQQDNEIAQVLILAAEKNDLEILIQSE